MQIMAQVVSPTTTGDPSAQEMGGTDTARGMMIMNAKAQGLQGPKLMPLAYAQAQAVTQWIELFRENVVDDVPIPLHGKTGEPEWFEINGSDLEADFSIYPRPKSWLPHPREEQQAAMQNAFTTFGAILLNPDMPASLKEKILEVYGIDNIDLNDYSLETRDAMLRVDQLEELEPEAVKLAEWLAPQIAEQQAQQQAQAQMQQAQAQQMPPQMQQGPPEQAQAGPPQPPQQGQPAPEEEEIPSDPAELAGMLLAKMVPPDEDLDDPQPYLDYFKRYLKGDEGRDASPVLRSAIKAQWKQYNKMQQDAQQAQMEMQAQMMAMAEQAKLPLEQARSEGRLADTHLKGQIEMAKIQATPPMPKAEPPDNVMRDKITEAAISAAQEDQKHKHRLTELGLTQSGKMRETLARGAMTGAQRDAQSKLPKKSKAGVKGSLVEGAPLVPALGGLPDQPAI